MSKCHCNFDSRSKKPGPNSAFLKIIYEDDSKISYIITKEGRLSQIQTSLSKEHNLSDIDGLCLAEMGAQNITDDVSAFIKENDWLNHKSPISFFVKRKNRFKEYYLVVLYPDKQEPSILSVKKNRQEVLAPSAKLRIIVKKTAA